jgi:hypothetical protein
MSVFDMTDPQSVGLLSLGLRLMSTPGKLGQALGQSGLGAMNDMQGAMQSKQRGELANLQIQRAQMEQKAAEDAARRQQMIEEAARLSMRTPEQQAMMGGGGPTMANAAKIDPSAGPSFDQNAFLNRLSGIDPLTSLDWRARLAKQTPQPIKVGSGETLLDPTTFKQVFSNPKATDQPSAVREYEYAKGQGYQGTFEQWDTARKKAGASNVNVPINMGQKGFDNTLKLRGDFRSEPVYKAHQEMQSAYSQIQQSLKQASPAGDLAGATKIMKLLDPGSVVRESELGMAMAASGLMDRVQNYASMVISGQKLTPTQRQDFQRLADALYSESVSQYNRKRDEYRGIVERNQLNEADVIGAPSVAPASPGAVDALVNKYRSKPNGNAR